MTTDKKKSALIDLDFFESRRQVGEDFVVKLIDVFSQEAPKLVQKIKAAAKDKRRTELGEMGHKLKGMCLNVGADKLSGLGREIESQAKNESLDSLEILVKDLDKVLKNTLKEMKQLI
jgi:hypothetical protein